MSTEKAPLPKAVREQIEALIPVLHYVKGIQHTQSLDDFYRMHLTALWEAAAQQERALRDALYELTAVGYLFVQEYNRDNIAITTWQRMGARLGLAHDLLHPVDEPWGVASHPPPTPEDR